MNDLRESAKRYIKEIYLSHRETDIESWCQLINVIIDYCEVIMKDHNKKYHGEENDKTDGERT